MIKYKLEKNNKYVCNIKMDEQGLIGLACLFNLHIKFCQDEKENNRPLSFMSVRTLDIAKTLMPQIEKTLKSKYINIKQLNPLIINFIGGFFLC